MPNIYSILSYWICSDGLLYSAISFIIINQNYFNKNKKILD